MEKYDKLKQILQDLKRVLVAFSGGVDSCFLSYTAREVLGAGNVLAVTADSETFTAEELAYARDFCRRFAIPHQVLVTCELDEINRHGNSKNRCYYCKKELFSRLKELAREGGYAVVEGSNRDDLQDYRPGFQAVQELAVSSPLKEAGLTKQEIRVLSKAAGLPSWDKPAYACLTSRFPYNTPITEEALMRVEAAEKYLHELGFRQCRVRHYGEKARVEVAAEKVSAALDQAEQITDRLRQLGYRVVEIDSEGYRMGSMNLFTGA